MAKYINSVRFLVKEDQQEAFENLFKEPPGWVGLKLHVLSKTGERSYLSCGLWENEEAMKAARPEMIDFLDKGRHLLDIISPELGVTDPVSGPIIVEHN